MPMTPSPRFFVDRKAKKGLEGVLMPKAVLCQTISQTQKSVVGSSNKHECSIMITNTPKKTCKQIILTTSK